MAHLRPARRGQLLIVGGVVVAFAVVGLAIVLNTVVLTESLETREPPRGLDSAREHELVVERGTNHLVREEGRIEYATWTDARANATAGVARIGSLLGNRTLQSGAVVSNATVNSTTRGATLLQTDPARNFSDDDGNSSWTLATTPGIRNYWMTVDGRNLTGVSDATSTDITGGLPGFTVNVSGADGHVWQAYVTATTGDSVRIVTRLDSEAPSIACKSVGSNATIGWTAGRVGTRDCDFTFARGLTAPYTIRYDDADEATGTYHLVVSNVGNSSVEFGNFTAGGNPRTHPAVYSLVVTVVYDGPNVDRDTDVRVAPGEPPQTSPA